MEKFDVLIIGGGPASITISKIIGGKLNTAVIRPEDHSMIYCAMPYVIQGIFPIEKSFKKDSLVTDSGAKLIRDYVIRVDFDKKQVETEKGNIYSYEKLVIATGAEPIIPPIKGTDLDGVFVFKTEKHLRDILRFLEDASKAVVVGAGAIGIELAQAIKQYGIDTYLVDMADQILPNLADKEMVASCEEDLKKQEINLFLNKKVSEIKGNGFVESVILDDGCEVQLAVNGKKGMVAFVVGVRANVELFKNTGLEIGRDGIVVNSKMETNIKDVYAVGDCVQFKSAITGEIAGGKLATNAVAMGRLLAKNFLGANREYRGFINGAATKVGEYYIGGTGLTERVARQKFDIEVEYAELFTAFPIMPFSKKVKMKIIVNKENKKLIGGQVVSGNPVTDKIDILTMAIQYGIPVDQLVYFSYSAQPYQSFYPANNLLVACCEKILPKLK